MRARGCFELCRNGSLDLSSPHILGTQFPYLDIRVGIILLLADFVGCGRNVLVVFLDML